MTQSLNMRSSWPMRNEEILINSLPLQNLKETPELGQNRLFSFLFTARMSGSSRGSSTAMQQLQSSSAASQVPQLH